MWKAVSQRTSPPDHVSLRPTGRERYPRPETGDCDLSATAVGASVNDSVVPARPLRLNAPVAGSRQVAFCVVGLVLVLVAACCGRPTSQAASSSPARTGPIASSLPPGVCAPTYAQLENADATRIEAKLVTFDSLSTSDPNFPPGWRTPPRSAYFWVVAEVGNFTVESHNPVALPTAATFHMSIGYIQTTSDPKDPETLVNPCRGIGGSLSGATTWPRWFDQMPALIDVKIR